MFYRYFLFGEDSGTANVIDVLARDLYRPGKGCGFVVGFGPWESEEVISVPVKPRLYEYVKKS